VFVRDSGGTAVPHGAGILNLSSCCPAPPRIWPTTTGCWGRPCSPCWGTRSCGQLRLRARLVLRRPVQPGDRGRKVTGTAQRWLAPGRDHDGAVLAQAMLLVAGDVDEGTRMASRFYELAGGELRFLRAPPPPWRKPLAGKRARTSWWRGCAAAHRAADPGGATSAPFIAGTTTCPSSKTPIKKATTRVVAFRLDGWSQALRPSAARARTPYPGPG
jgi:hypothetical protein